MRLQPLWSTGEGQMYAATISWFKPVTFTVEIGTHSSPDKDRQITNEIASTQTSIIVLISQNFNVWRCSFTSTDAALFSYLKNIWPHMRNVTLGVHPHRIQLIASYLRAWFIPSPLLIFTINLPPSPTRDLKLASSCRISGQSSTTVQLSHSIHLSLRTPPSLSSMWDPFFGFLST